MGIERKESSLQYKKVVWKSLKSQGLTAEEALDVFLQNARAAVTVEGESGGSDLPVPDGWSPGPAKIADNDSPPPFDCIIDHPGIALDGLDEAKKYIAAAPVVVLYHSEESYDNFISRVGTWVHQCTSEMNKESADEYGTVRSWPTMSKVTKRLLEVADHASFGDHSVDKLLKTFSQSRASKAGEPRILTAEPINKAFTNVQDQLLELKHQEAMYELQDAGEGRNPKARTKLYEVLGRQRYWAHLFWERMEAVEKTQVPNELTHAQACIASLARLYFCDILRQISKTMHSVHGRLRQAVWQLQKKARNEDVKAFGVAVNIVMNPNTVAMPMAAACEQLRLRSDKSTPLSNDQLQTCAQILQTFPVMSVQALLVELGVGNGTREVDYAVPKPKIRIRMAETSPDGDDVAALFGDFSDHENQPTVDELQPVLGSTPGLDEQPAMDVDPAHPIESPAAPVDEPQPVLGSTPGLDEQPAMDVDPAHPIEYPAVLADEPQPVLGSTPGLDEQPAMDVDPAHSIESLPVLCFPPGLDKPLAADVVPAQRSAIEPPAVLVDEQQAELGSPPGKDEPHAADVVPACSIETLAVLGAPRELVPEAIGDDLFSERHDFADSPDTPPKLAPPPLDGDAAAEMKSHVSPKIGEPLKPLADLPTKRKPLSSLSDVNVKCIADQVIATLPVFMVNVGAQTGRRVYLISHEFGGVGFLEDLLAGTAAGDEESQKSPGNIFLQSSHANAESALERSLSDDEEDGTDGTARTRSLHLGVRRTLSFRNLFFQNIHNQKAKTSQKTK